MKIRRSDANARKALRRLSWLAVGAAFLVLLKFLGGEKTALKILLLAAWIAFLFLAPPMEELVARLAKAWAPRVKGNDLLWHGARLILILDAAILFPFRALGRAVKRLAAWFAATPAGRLVDRHRRRLAFALTLMVLYRVAALFRLYAMGGDAGLLDWAVFGLGYGLFGATALFIGFLAADPRREWGVVAFVAWHLIAMVGVLVAFATAAYAAATGGGEPHYLASVPTLPGLFLLAVELLLHIFALRWFGPVERPAPTNRTQPTGA